MTSNRVAAFWGYVQKTGGCWLWTGNTLRGYGTFSDGTRTVRAHRFAYALLKGPIPEGLVLDHLCRVKHCVNPAHLEAVAQRENMARGNLAEMQLRAYRDKTHCRSGHEYTAENTGTARGRRLCLTCRRASRARWRNKLRRRHASEGER